MKEEGERDGRKEEWKEGGGERRGDRAWVFLSGKMTDSQRGVVLPSIQHPVLGVWFVPPTNLSLSHTAFLLYVTFLHLTVPDRERAGCGDSQLSVKQQRAEKELCHGQRWTVGVTLRVFL